MRFNLGLKLNIKIKAANWCRPSGEKRCRALLAKGDSAGNKGNAAHQGGYHGYNYSNVKPVAARCSACHVVACGSHPTWQLEDYWGRNTANHRGPLTAVRKFSRESVLISRCGHAGSTVLPVGLRRVGGPQCWPLTGCVSGKPVRLLHRKKFYVR